ncbi:MAG: histidinol-phosphate transaminase [Desulfovibrionaceae bacterium]
MSVQSSVPVVRPEVARCKAYVPGLSIDEIRQKYHLDTVIKMASNENPLGTSPLVQAALQRHAAKAFRYPQGGNPRLVAALAAFHRVDPARIVLGNGSDEIIDMLLRMRAAPHVDNMVCFRPCFSIYPLQAQLCGIEVRQQNLAEDFSFSWQALRALVDEHTALVFVTTPDNPSGWCPPRDEVLAFARSLPAGCLLVVDEAYMDFADDEQAQSLLHVPDCPENILFLRTFSKSFGLAGLRLGYGIFSPVLAEYFWRVRLPFSVNILAEEAGLAALDDDVFRAETLRVVREGRHLVHKTLTAMGCTVYPSQANFCMFAPPPSGPPALELFEQLLRQGIIIRPLQSYALPHLLRVSVGNTAENAAFVHAMHTIVARP